MEQNGFRVNDVIFFPKLSGCREAIDAGLKPNQEYLITFVFLGGSCVLLDVNKEYIVRSDLMELASFIYNAEDVGTEEFDDLMDSYDEEVYGEMMNALTGAFGEGQNYTIKYHTFNVNDWIEIKDIRQISFADDMGLENNKPYLVIGKSEYLGSIFIKTDYGSFEIFKEEFAYLVKSDKMTITKETESITNEIVESQLQYLIDKALDEEDWVQLEKLRSYMNGGIDMTHKTINEDGLSIHNVPHENGKMSFGTILNLSIIKGKMKTTGVKICDYENVYETVNKKEMA